MLGFIFNFFGVFFLFNFNFFLILCVPRVGILNFFSSLWNLCGWKFFGNDCGESWECQNSQIFWVFILFYFWKSFSPLWNSCLKKEKKKTKPSLDFSGNFFVWISWILPGYFYFFRGEIPKSCRILDCAASRRKTSEKAENSQGFALRAQNLGIPGKNTKKGVKKLKKKIKILCWKKNWERFPNFQPGFLECGFKKN